MFFDHNYIFYNFQTPKNHQQSQNNHSPHEIHFSTHPRLEIDILSGSHDWACYGNFSLVKFCFAVCVWIQFKSENRSNIHDYLVMLIFHVFFFHRRCLWCAPKKDAAAWNKWIKINHENNKRNDNLWINYENWSGASVSGSHKVASPSRFLVRH